jgi:4-amino-4-deoxy-L-arabinose transferase-like glycosyltransferase
MTLRLRSLARFAVVVAALVVLAGQCYWSARTSSGTSDEPEHIVSGLVALRTGDFRMNVAHPPLMEALCGAAALLAHPPPLRTDSESWRTAHQIRYAIEYLWRGPAAAKAVRIILLARLPVIAVSLGLGCLVLCWAQRLYGWAAAALALVLYCLEPNILAHSSLATNDLAVTAGWVLCVFAYWRHLGSPSVPKMVLVGAALGLAMLSKFSGALLVVVLPLLAALHWYLFRSVRPWRLAVGLIAAVLIACLVIWAGYGFGIQPVSRAPGALRLPAGQYLAGIGYQLGHVQRGHPIAYLFGQVSTSGWWYYFPVAFLVKTPLPLLILLGLALWLRKLEKDEWYLLVPVAVMLAVAVAQSLNYGLRHVLPVYPFLIIFAARVLARPWPERHRRWMPRVVIALGAWMAVEAGLYAPQYLAYFNELTGGPAGGSRVLADSNLDWGQDLFRLAAWQKRHPEARPLYFSYFGTSDPLRYGVRAEPLLGLAPSFPMKTQAPDWAQQSVAPRAGWIAISVDCLRLVPWYHWLQQFRPVDRAGYSILVYFIPEAGINRLPVGERP